MNEKHIPPDELADYFALRLTETRESEIEEHFAECALCSEQGRSLQTLAGALDGWTAGTHGRAHRRAPLAAALERAEAYVPNPAWRERISRWRERWADRAEAAVHVIMEAPQAGWVLRWAAPGAVAAALALVVWLRLPSVTSLPAAPTE